MYDQKIKVVEDFVWLLITDKAKEVYQSGLFDGAIYVLYDDGSEDACETYEDLLIALENGLDIGIEVGHVTPPKPKVVEWYNDLMNLDVTTFRNLDPIMEAKTDEEWIKAGQQGIPAWCYYENDEKHNARFGKLYNWYAVNDKRGLAPEGYRVPTIKELDALNVPSFGIVPAGWRNHAKTIHGNYFTSFQSIRSNGFFWSSSEDKDDSDLAWHRYFINYCDTDSQIDVNYKSIGASVICIKD
jgi:uncharacterized protein (TIGR02145 family)